ncbi:hypothetical protein LOZ36_002200 [Ophidiomyces ophidiicola]|nr:hypothetical protein LOZ36_002200 [Ophidiomyces ophidiicola]
MSESDDAYNFLLEVFADRHGCVYDIEVLPPGFGPLLRDGASIGITKRALAQAFVIARGIFFKWKNADSDSANNEKSPAEEGLLFDDVGVKIASEIILLFDSEHLTACNWRRQRLLRLKKIAKSDEYIEAVQEEVSFTTTLLRSPLHRHAKSPTIWHHRYWIMIEIFQLGIEHAAKILSKPEEASPIALQEDDAVVREMLLQHELVVALRAGEQHPMNYYAFSYLRQFLSLSTPAECQSSLNHLQSEGTEALEMVHKWCLSHPHDISGWMFLLHMLELLNNKAGQTAFIAGTVSYALDVDWEGEALWIFLKISLSRFKLDLTSLDSRILTAYQQKRSTGIRDSKHRWMDLAAQAKIDIRGQIPNVDQQRNV